MVARHIEKHSQASQPSQKKAWMESIGDKRITILLQEEEDISTRVLVEATKEVITINPAQLQKEEVTISMGAIQKRKQVLLIIQM